ncbi:MAG TPA: enoyl-CoA hydratase-related protein [Streptosporangiaceae bacterium]
MEPQQPDGQDAGQPVEPNGVAVPGAALGRLASAREGAGLAADGAELDGVRLHRHQAGAAGGTIAEVILDRPAAMNALNTAMLVRLADVLTRLGADPLLRAVVLVSAGERSFCVGADLRERAGMSDAQMMAQRPAFRAAFGALLELPQPVIAAVDGFALGGGCELALSCDLIVAGQSAVFGLPEVTVGLVPGCGGTQLTARRLGPGLAAELVLTGRRVGAEEAARIGLADRVVPEGTAAEHALDIALQIAANAPVAVRAAKRAIRLGSHASLPAALEIEDAAWRTAVLSADRKEGIAAFAEKRSPRWRGE